SLWWRYRKAQRDRRFDRRYNVQTAGTLTPRSFGVARNDRLLSVRYLSCEPEEFERGLGALPARHEDFTFVDLRSGKGKALFPAAAYPFRRIVGVELSPRLHRIAERNVASFRSDTQRCHAFELQCKSVLDFEVPLEPLVFFLYNPFL